MRRAILWFRSMFLRRRLEREMQEEMSLHIERATERYVRRGMSRADAVIAARREFGNFDYIEEAARDARGMRWIDALRSDVRFALRHFRRTPFTTATMIVVLALGIGVNVGLFGVIHSVTTLPGPAIPRDAALVRIRGLALSPSANRSFARPMSYPEVVAYSGQRQLFSSVAATIGGVGMLSTVGAERTPSRAGMTYTSDNFFALLRVGPQLGTLAGTTPLSADAGDALRAVIGHTVWQDLFDGATDVVGRTLRVNGVPVTVVGVMPPKFRGTVDAGPEHRVWLPLAAYPLIERSSLHAFASADSALFHAVARLQPGISRTEATPVVKAVAARAISQMTELPDRSIATADVAPLLPFNVDPQNDRNIRLVTAGVGAVTLLLLLVTCTNVSSLLVGMALARRREIAVRLSLGAGRPRLIAQLLTESVLLALAAGALALAVIVSFIAYIDARAPEAMIGEHIVFDWRATLFTCGVALLTAVLFGLSPALHATRLALADVLKDAGAAVSGSRSRLQRALVVAQITLTQPLLVALAVTALIGYAELRQYRPAPDDDRRVEMYFEVTRGARHADAVLGELGRIRERLAAVPGVVAVAPETYDITRRMVLPETGSSLLPDTMFVSTRLAVPGYLAVHDVPIIRGRDFAAADLDSLPAAVILDDKFARALFGDMDPIGRRISLLGDPLPKTIVGVVDEEQTRVLRGGRQGVPLVFLSTPRTGIMTNWMLVRTAGPGAALIPALRAAATAEVPQLALRFAYTRETRRADNMRELLQIGAALGIGGAITLLLSAIGLYAVVAVAVNQRTREIGIRTALGARRLQVAALFFRSGLRLSVFGLLIGLPLSLLALQVFGDFRGDLTRMLTLAGFVGGGVLFVASLATWIPARRAAGIDPLQALRSE